MRFLLVEDDENKRNQIGAWIEVLYPDAEFYIARSLQSGVRAIKQGPFDVVLLDMTLPNYDVGPDEPGGGNTHNFGGREFLKQMDRFEILVPVIVITQFETFGKAPLTMDLSELDSQLSAEHKNYVAAVYYHASIHGWKEHVKSLLSGIFANGIISK